MANYNVYTALLTQSGTNAPVATVLENTLGDTLTWYYDGIGTYSVYYDGASSFILDKTIVFFTIGGDYGTTGLGSINYDVGNNVSDGGINIRVYNVDLNTISLTNNGMVRTSIEIRVYA